METRESLNGQATILKKDSKYPTSEKAGRRQRTHWRGSLADELEEEYYKRDTSSTAVLAKTGKPPRSSGTGPSPRLKFGRSQVNNRSSSRRSPQPRGQWE
mmetsp:Transcript_27285/g.45149  ORF Transcript_27285/g.45149 Transcript_27285/m.45149 type:complete len:100 (-) Transcript_27285:121-420(-)